MLSYRTNVNEMNHEEVDFLQSFESLKTLKAFYASIRTQKTALSSIMGFSTIVSRLQFTGRKEYNF